MITFCPDPVCFLLLPPSPPSLHPLQAEKIQALVEEAVKQGARLLAGGRVNPDPKCLGGFMEPTLLVDVTPEMSIAQHEVFGPVMVMFRAEDDEDAIRIVRMEAR